MQPLRSRFGLLLLALPTVAYSAAPPAGGFPWRSGPEVTGTEFGAQHADSDDHTRYAAARDEILRGNVPDFLRDLVPVILTRPPGVTVGPESVTVFVTPDYLAVGTDEDFLTVPLDLVDAAQLAERLGFALPTPLVVDAIYAAAEVRVEPIPMPPGPSMRSMDYVLEHRALVAEGRVGQRLGALVAGTKKDLVLTGALRTNPDREAIYGWHHLDGDPIQQLCLWHGDGYADYSHGVRLVADTILVDGEAWSYYAALADPMVAPLLSGEGPIPDAAQLLADHR